MRKHHRPPLFQGIEPDQYLVDTSAWLNIRLCDHQDDIWTTIRNLIEVGRLFSCSQVIEELKEDGIYLPRIKEFEEALKSGERNDISFLMEVGKITFRYPSMSRATGTRTPADPYVIALALLEKYVVVADESMKRPNRKIPGACEELKIKCMTLNEFIAKEVNRSVDG